MSWKIGDKARVYNKDASFLGSVCFENGDTTTVELVLPGRGIVVTDTIRGGFHVPLTMAEAENTLTKIEEENTLTKLVAVAKRDSAGHEIHEHQEFRKGDVFEIITEPVDLMTVIIFGQLKAHGDDEKAILVNFGSGFMVFFKEESEQAFNFNEFFDQKEVN
jgi:hypothetical protein